MIPVNEPLLAGNELAYINDCVNTAWISSAGKYVDRFESEWAAYCNRKFGVSVTNGTAALELAISVLRLPAGSEVILPSFTIVSCIEAVLRNGLTPVLVDCDPKTFCMDANHVVARISENTSAIMPVHIYGHPANMERILKIAKMHNVKIIEDAAEAHGAECAIDGKWQKCGSFGDVSTFSFYANKNITCGEGGMVLTDDNELADRLRARRNLCFGKQERFFHEDRGWNFRMTNMQAAIGCAQLERIDDILRRKLEIANRYHDGLKDLSIMTPYVESWATTSVWMYAVVFDESISYDAVECAQKLMKRGVQTRPFFRGMHEQAVYQQLGLFVDEVYPVTEHISRRGLYLPSGQALTNDQIDEVISAIKNTLGT